ncbi:MAG: hypothetical protein WAL03_05230, partial [Pseudolabrys sp.]
AGADDDAVIGFFERFGQKSNSRMGRDRADALRLPVPWRAGQWPALHGRKAENTGEIECRAKPKYSSRGRMWTF